MPGWRFLLLIRISNFAILRRHVGKARADRLSHDLKVRIDRILPCANSTIDRQTVEADLLGHSLADAMTALECVAAAFREPIDVDGESHRVDLALAAAAGPVGGVDDVRLAEEAEAALVQALAEHRLVVRDITTVSPSIDRLSLCREMESAIERDEVFLQYQPKMHVRRQQVASAEALVRWEHPDRGLILPNDFIPLAEETHLIGPLTLWTLRRVIADQQILVEDGHDLVIFVNISGQLLSDRAFIDAACGLITANGAKIGFEITETSMIRDPGSAVEHLNIAAAAGIPIAIDDYGAGLSSLAYLKKLPATELKIDKMFVMELTSSNRDPLIVRSTIDLAHAMEMEVTAEGVETPAALALLSVMGCDQVQGFLLSRPLSLPAFRHFMATEAQRGIEPPAFALRQPGSFWKAA
ncbi:EAL domain-containing protein [uncultured Sphingomonas sp.]|uniref:EAL domain-containing protein n=1 Tax=uncultured Sphingomonas sp. TaxID=158754 RepID=UPI0035CA7102